MGSRGCLHGHPFTSSLLFKNATIQWVRATLLGFAFHFMKCSCGQTHNNQFSRSEDLRYTEAPKVSHTDPIVKGHRFAMYFVQHIKQLVCLPQPTQRLA